MCKFSSVRQKVWTKREAARLILKKLKEGKVQGGRYWRPNGNQCAIGHLIGVDESRKEEQGRPAPAPGYRLAVFLIRDGVLRVSKGTELWFGTLQALTDEMGSINNAPARARLEDFLREAAGYHAKGSRAKAKLRRKHLKEMGSGWRSCGG